MPMPAADRQARGQGDAVEEAVDAHAGRADDADVLVRDGVVVQLGRGLVADMEDGDLVDRVEGQEARRDPDHRRIDASRGARPLPG